MVTGSGANERCVYVSSMASGFTCASGYSSGPCPSTHLYGCCIVTETPDGGSSVETATCYYSKSNGTKAEQNCETMEYEGFPNMWENKAP
jgi:hypothetical protein